jgi:DNA-binding PadR family transcriptional regulator
MRILETIAQSLRTQRIHPTQVYNALIELENAGGVTTMFELEYRLSRLVRAMFERHDQGINIAQAWLDATRAYLEEYGQIAPVAAPPLALHRRILEVVHAARANASRSSSVAAKAVRGGLR